MSPSAWGPPIWNFLHTLAAKVKEEKYPEMCRQLFFFIQKICANLPCPECSQHAKIFLERVVLKKVSTKNDLINLLFIFHNAVNHKKMKPLFPIEETKKYSQNNIIIAYNQFITAFNTKGNMKLLADSFQRKLILQELKKWLIQNLSNFDR